MIGFILAFTGGALILSIGETREDLMPFFTSICRFGIAFNFSLSYVGTVQVFPVLFCGTAFGVCNFFARAMTVAAPLVAEIEGALPMSLFCLVQVLGFILCFFIQPKSQLEYHPDKKSA